METFDFVIIGAGPAGEAAANEARAHGASVAVADRLWFGGSCPFIGCIPSKALLNSAARHAANPPAYPVFCSTISAALRRAICAAMAPRLASTNCGKNAKKKSAVMVVSEGAGQNLMTSEGSTRRGDTRRR